MSFLVLHNYSSENMELRNGESDMKEMEDKEKEEIEKFALRPSAPAHKRIKESPLSSAFIFKQDIAAFTICRIPFSECKTKMNPEGCAPRIIMLNILN